MTNDRKCGRTHTSKAKMDCSSFSSCLAWISSIWSSYSDIPKDMMHSLCTVWRGPFLSSSDENECFAWALDEIWPFLSLEDVALASGSMLLISALWKLGLSSMLALKKCSSAKLCLLISRSLTDATCRDKSSNSFSDLQEQNALIINKYAFINKYLY